MREDLLQTKEYSLFESLFLYSKELDSVGCTILMYDPVGSKRDFFTYRKRKLVGKIPKVTTKV